MVDVILNQDGILDFPKCLLDFSVPFYFQKGHVMIWAANQLQETSLAIMRFSQKQSKKPIVMQTHLLVHILQTLQVNIHWLLEKRNMHTLSKTSLDTTHTIKNRREISTHKCQNFIISLFFYDTKDISLLFYAFEYYFWIISQTNT